MFSHCWKKLELQLGFEFGPKLQLKFLDFQRSLNNFQRLELLGDGQQGHELHLRYFFILFSYCSSFFSFFCVLWVPNNIQSWVWMWRKKKRLGLSLAVQLLYGWVQTQHFFRIAKQFSAPTIARYGNNKFKL